MTPSSDRRSGFTLVELLVVIAIIAMLMALVTPAVMRVRASAVNAKVKAEIDMLHTALMNYKNEYGSLPPADLRDLWNTSRNQVNTNSRAYRHLVRLFPRLAENPSGDKSLYKYMAQMTPAQALVFWLQGFYDNQEYPLTNGSWPPSGTRKKLYDFEETRLFAATAYAAGNGQTFKKRSDATTTLPSGFNFEKEFPVYMTAHQSAGLPYVYFDSRCYSDPVLSDLSYIARNLSGDDSTAFPYFTSNPPANPIWSQWHVAADTFQIIAAGADGKYGGNAASFPLAVKAVSESKSLDVPAVTNEVLAVGHQDNVTNFASGPLGNAAAAQDK